MRRRLLLLLAGQCHVTAFLLLCRQVPIRTFCAVAAQSQPAGGNSAGAQGTLVSSKLLLMVLLIGVKPPLQSCAGCLMKREASSTEHLLTLVKFSPNMIPRNNISPVRAFRAGAAWAPVRPFIRQRLPARERVTNRHFSKVRPCSIRSRRYCTRCQNWPCSWRWPWATR